MRMIVITAAAILAGCTSGAITPRGGRTMDQICAQRAGTTVEDWSNQRQRLLEERAAEETAVFNGAAPSGRDYDAEIADVEAKMDCFG